MVEMHNVYNIDPSLGTAQNCWNKVKRIRVFWSDPLENAKLGICRTVVPKCRGSGTDAACTHGFSASSYPPGKIEQLIDIGR